MFVNGAEVHPETSELLSIWLAAALRSLAIDNDESLKQEGLESLQHWHKSKRNGSPTPRHVEALQRESVYKALLQQLGQLGHKRQVDFILFKGGALLYDIYPAGARSLTDLDVLVRPEQMQSAEELLVSAGYRRMRNFSVFSKGDWTIDLHDNPLNQLRSVWQPDLDELWKNSTILSSETGPLRRLALEDEYAVVLAHATKHGFSKARWLVDIALLARAADKVKLRNLLNRSPVLAKFHHYAARLLEKIFACQLPEGLAPVQKFNLLDKLFLKKVQQRKAGENFGMLIPASTIPGWLAKLKYVDALLFPQGHTWERLGQINHKLLYALGLPLFRWRRQRIRRRAQLATRRLHDSEAQT
jgi:hypothetical protein